MQNVTGTAYHSNHATFELPAQLKDKTMHMFTLNDSGPSEFSVVMSHADVQEGETLADFSDRLLKELGRALPKFQLRGMVERTLDGEAAVEFAYGWRNDGNFMHQRQAIALVEGTRPGTTEAMMIAATCLNPFTDEWNAAFDGILDSVKLRRKTAPAAAPAGAAPVPGLPVVFALSERRRTLHAFADRDEACRKTDAREVEQDAWAFFDADGSALHANFVVPNSGTLWRKAGSYVLEARPDQAAASLGERLHLVAMYVPGTAAVPYATLAELQAHFRPPAER
jgi:hypothetical protein